MKPAANSVPGPARIHHLIEQRRDVWAHCNRCQHLGELPVSVFLERGATLQTPVPDLKRWCRCSRCGSRDVVSRPDPYPAGLSGTAGASR